MLSKNRLKLMCKSCCLYTVGQKFQTQVSAVVGIEVLVFFRIIIDLINV